MSLQQLVVPFFLHVCISAFLVTVFVYPSIFQSSPVFFFSLLYFLSFLLVASLPCVL